MMIRTLFIVFAIAIGLLWWSYSKADLPEPMDIPVEKDFMEMTHVPLDIELMLQDNCYVCHSKSVDYPLKSKFYPYSKPYRENVQKGRDILNFSNWQSYSSEEQKMLLIESMEQIRNHIMPIPLAFGPTQDSMSVVDKRRLMEWFAELAEVGL